MFQAVFDDPVLIVHHTKQAALMRSHIPGCKYTDFFIRYIIQQAAFSADQLCGFTRNIHANRLKIKVGINVSGNGFDDTMICYPNVIVHNGKKYMVYNGNNFGYDGFGLAVLEE